MGWAEKIVKTLPTGRGISLDGLKLIGDRLLLRLEEPGKTAGGLVIPENANHDPVGVVVAIGDRYGVGGTVSYPTTALEIGDRVMFDPSGAKRVGVNGEHLILIHGAFVFARLGSVGIES